MKGSRSHLFVHPPNLEKLIEQRTAELQESEEALKEAQRIARMGSWHWDFSQGSVTLSDELFVVLRLKRATSSVKFMDCLKLFTIESRRRLYTAMRGTFQNQKGFSLDLETTDASGHNKWITVRGEVVRDLLGAVVGLRGTAQDVTEKKEIELALIETSEKAELAARAKADFLAKMSHEIRTPLNIILGMTELIGETQMTAEQRGYVMSCKRATDFLLMLVNDTLDLSKIEEGKLQVTESEFDLRGTLQRLYDLIAFKAARKGLSLEFSVSEHVPTVVRGDKERISQVILNLLGNALKFTKEGRVRLSIEVDGPSAPEKVCLRFKITDTGVGIADEKINSLFQRFFQADPGVSTQLGGTGLGLTISKRLVTLMGGEIGVLSRLGSGSTFWFTLPLHVVERSKSIAKKHSSLDGTMPMDVDILLVDDAEDNRMLVRAYLKKSSCRITDAADGAEAFEKFKANRFDVVLMDVQMPNMDGYEATHRIRRWEKEAGREPTPIIAVTAFAFKEDKEKSKAAGCSFHLSKPVKKKELFEAIIKFTSSGASAPP